MYLSARQAYMAMYFFLDGIWELKKTDRDINGFDDFTDLVSDLNPLLFKKSMSADPAAWEDWIRCISKTCRYSVEQDKVSSEEAFESMLRFINIYIKEMKFNLKWLIELVMQYRKLEDSGKSVVSWDRCAQKCLEI